MVAGLQYFRFCLFQMYVNVVFVIICLYSAVNLTLVKEQRFIRIIIIIIYLFIYLAMKRADQKSVPHLA